MKAGYWSCNKDNCTYALHAEDIKFTTSNVDRFQPNYQHNFGRSIELWLVQRVAHTQPGEVLSPVLSQNVDTPVRVREEKQCSV